MSTGRADAASARLRVPRIGAIVLAAGGSQRLGEPKQLLRDDTGQTLVARTVEALRGAAYEPIIVVVGAHAEDVTHALIQQAGAVYLVPNGAWEEGMGSSIRKAVAFLCTQPTMRDVEGVTIAACDMPSADATHYRALRDAAVMTSDDVTRVVRVASTYGREHARGIPALLPRDDWPALLALEGDRGAKALFEQSETGLVSLSGGAFDIDTPDDVAAWRTSSPD